MNTEKKLHGSQGFQYEISESVNSEKEQETEVEKQKTPSKTDIKDSFEDLVEYIDESDEETEKKEVSKEDDDTKVLESSQEKKDFFEEEQEETVKNEEKESQAPQKEEKNPQIQETPEKDLNSSQNENNLTKEIPLSPELFKENNVQESQGDELESQERDVIKLLADFENTVNQNTLQEGSVPEHKTKIKVLKKKSKQPKKQEENPKKDQDEADNEKDIVEIIEKHGPSDSQTSNSQKSQIKPNQILNTDIQELPQSKKRASLSKQIRAIEDNARKTALNEKLSTQKKEIFKGIYFIITHAPDVQTHIERCGGKILEVEDFESDNFDDENVVLIADKHRRTIKYLIGLALSVPILSQGWVYDCLKANDLIEPLPQHYLYAGMGINIEDHSLNASFTQDDLAIIAQTQSFKTKPLKESQRVLYRRKIFLEAENERLHSEWQILVKLTGAQICKNVEECNFILFIGKSYQLSSKTKEQAITYNRDVMIQEYLIQCLITNTEIKRFVNLRIDLEDQPQKKVEEPSDAKKKLKTYEKKKVEKREREEEEKTQKNKKKKEEKSTQKKKTTPKKKLEEEFEDLTEEKKVEKTTPKKKLTPKKKPQREEEEEEEEKVETTKKSNEKKLNPKKKEEVDIEEKVDEKELISKLKKLYQEKKTKECTKLLEDAKMKMKQLQSFIEFAEKLLD